MIILVQGYSWLALSNICLSDFLFPMLLWNELSLLFCSEMSLLCWCAGHLQQRNRSEPWIWFCHYEYCRGGWEGCGDVPSLCECIWWSYFSWQILGLVMVKIACLLMVATSHLIKFAHLCYAVRSLHINMLHVNINILVGHRGIGFSFLRHGGSNWYTTKFIRIENLWNVLTPCRTQKSLIKQVTKLALFPPFSCASAAALSAGVGKYSFHCF